MKKRHLTTLAAAALAATMFPGATLAQTEPYPAAEGEPIWQSSVLNSANGVYVGPDGNVYAASVFGEGFHPDGVLAVLGDDHASELTHWLPKLEAATLIEAVVATDTGLDAGYAFHHALLREAAYATLPEGDRPLAHHLAAAWLEQQPAPDALAIAEQWRRSNRPDRAARWYERAAFLLRPSRHWQSASRSA